MAKAGAADEPVAVIRRGLRFTPSSFQPTRSLPIAPLYPYRPMKLAGTGPVAAVARWPL